MWITYGGYDAVKAYESVDEGGSWLDISAGLPEVTANTIIQNKRSKTQQLYAGTDLGVFFKEGSSNWTLFSNDLPSVIVTELEIYYDETTPTNSTLYASTYGRGLWKSNLAVFEIALDIDAPTVEISSSESTSTSSSEFDVTITFNEVVNEFVESDIVVGNGIISSFTETNSQIYNVDVVPTVSGLVTVDVAAGVALDDAGNSNTAATQWSISYTATNIEKFNEYGIKIFPNPSNGRFTIERNNNNVIDISIVDLSGKVIYNELFNSDNSKMIDLTGLAKGLYIIQLNVENELLTSKILIE